jgi:lysosomal acid lipase/cholesteryl ester hydrolase
MGEFLPSSLLMDILAEMFCDEDSLPELCGSVLFLICGFDDEKLNTTLLDTIVHHTPAGASSKTLIHYGQEMASGNISNINS